MDQENAMDQNITSSGLNQEIQRSEGSPSWDDVYAPEEMDLDQPAGEEDRESEDQSIQKTPEIDIDDHIEDDVTDDDEQKNTPQETSRRVLKFSDYFNHSQ
jgi:hypothetical protein